MNGIIVNPDFVTALSELRAMAQRAFIRIPVFVFGDDEFVSSLLGTMPDTQWVSDKTGSGASLSWSKTKQLLGQELGSIALDLRYHIDVERLCAITGCVRGGELVFLIAGDKTSASSSLFASRFFEYANHDDVACICQHSGYRPPKNTYPDQHGSVSAERFRTDDQNTAIDAVGRVLHGHRRRPALLVADRGRGKSSSMGMAVSDILAKSPKHIIVTSPRFANAETLFRHAAQAEHIHAKGKFSLEADNGGTLQFVAPDALLREQPSCDLLMVDEAAAIPLPLLGDMLSGYSRIVFSSTEHGYEGSGRAFSTRFRALLDDNAKGWKEVKLHTPVRWAERDPLERWLFDAFLFDAEPISPSNKAAVSYRDISAIELAGNEALLKQLFALLITAHYQTSPNDLVQLLDGEEQQLIAAFIDEVLVGAVLLFREGGFEPQLAEDVVAGKRRLRGHLLAQSLASHVGLPEVLTSPLTRISRVAVLPACRRQGIGRALIAHAEQTTIQQGMGLIGTSFGATLPLWQFWSSLGYVPLRLGVSRDAASGTHSLQLVKPLGDSPSWYVSASRLFSCNFAHQLSEQFSELDPYLVAKLLAHREAPFPCEAINQQVALFADNHLGYDLCTGSLWLWLIHWLATNPVDNESKGCALLIARVLQRRPWQEMAKQFGYAGRKDTESAMRVWITRQLAHQQKGS